MNRLTLARLWGVIRRKDTHLIDSVLVSVVRDAGSSNRCQMRTSQSDRLLDRGI